MPKRTIGTCAGSVPRTGEQSVAAWEQVIQEHGMDSCTMHCVPDLNRDEPDGRLQQRSDLLHANCPMTVAVVQSLPDLVGQFAGWELDTVGAGRLAEHGLGVSYPAVRDLPAWQRPHT